MADEPEADAGTPRINDSDGQTASQDANAAGPPHIGRRLPPYIRKTPLPPGAEPPNYRQYLRWDWDADRAGRLLVGENPQNFMEASDDFLAMQKHFQEALNRGELPSEDGKFSAALDVFLWAHYSGQPLPEEYQSYAAKQARKANRIIFEFYLSREVVSLVEGINLIRGFPREIIETKIGAEECIAPDLYDYVEDRLDEAGLTILRADGKIDVALNDLLRLAHREGFWLPPRLQEAADSLVKGGEKPAGAEKAGEDLDLPVPTDLWSVVAQSRLLAKYHKYLFPSVDLEEVYENVRPFMENELGVAKEWIGSRKPTTVLYSWWKGIDTRQRKPGPKPQQTDRAESSETRGKPDGGEPSRQRRK